MFPVVSEPMPQTLLTGLFVLWAVLLFGGFAAGRINSERTHRTPRAGRLGSSLALVAAGWLWFVVSRDTAASGFAGMVALGMTLGCIGDFFMARVFPLKNYVLGGIASFGLGHVAYISAFVNFGDAVGMDAANARWIALAGWLLFGAAGWYIIVFRGQRPTALHLAALPYALLLAGTAGIATGLALQNSLFIPLAVGAALFLLSDLLLAAQLFNGLHFTLIGDVVWALYGPGQMLIVYSCAAALMLTS